MVSGRISEVEEQPRVQLDVTNSKSREKCYLELTLGNILNPPELYKVGDLAARKYRTGFTVGFSSSVDL